MEKRTAPDGGTLWQVKNTYYGKFLIYSPDAMEDPNRQLAMIP